MKQSLNVPEFVTAEARTLELQNQQKFEAGRPDLLGYLRKEGANLQSIRHRLLRRLEQSTIGVSFSDGTGEFTIEVRMLSPAEQAEVINLQIEMQKYQQSLTDINNLSTAAEKGTTLLNRFYHIVGEICVDQELTEEYWRKGVGHNFDVPLRLLAEALRQSRSYRDDLTFFRVNA